ncbi:hypothetical protein NEMBOFW57_009770 [Staphylotrichum longicolle]|uniref:Uncharacterized protein n=1 Tax=Staphylotrichum longicolle TaxID=669026 RepID=A0AAD4EPP7_9PEZI|nr:hypothetical protein NEMBOFW57_009770 [Staphylotrichum longicolle]
MCCSCPELVPPTRTGIRQPLPGTLNPGRPDLIHRIRTSRRNASGFISEGQFRNHHNGPNGRHPLFLFIFVTSVLANTEKAIFLGPEPVSIHLTHPILSDLRLHTLTPANGTLRTSLAAQFPSPDHPRGTATWLVLDNLTPNQRYEAYSASLQEQEQKQKQKQKQPDASKGSSSSGSSSSERDEASILLLRILAARLLHHRRGAHARRARRRRRHHPGPVPVQCPPRSIASTACYIVAVGVASYFLAGKVVSWIRGVIAGGAPAQGWRV